MIRKIQWIAMVVAAVLCAACDAHIDVPDTAVRPGHILCEDGTALSYAQYEQSGKRAIAVVFDTERRERTEGNGYAVYLWDIAPAAFADSLGVAQGTSADIGALDGNMNTFALYDTRIALLRFSIVFPPSNMTYLFFLCYWPQAAAWFDDYSIIPFTILKIL